MLPSYACKENLRTPRRGRINKPLKLCSTQLIIFFFLHLVENSPMPFLASLPSGEEKEALASHIMLRDLLTQKYVQFFLGDFG
jgi:hypothetical protein